jgi:hypothetical protein
MKDAASAFHRWHGDSRSGVWDVRSGLSPEVGDQLRPAEDEEGVPAHPWRIAAGLAVAWVLFPAPAVGAGFNSCRAGSDGTPIRRLPRYVTSRNGVGHPP